MTAEELFEVSEECSPFLRYAADTLTVSRFFISALILAAGFEWGASALRFALLALFAGWVTDCFDGTLARKSGTPRTWVSGVDLYADVSLIFAFFLFIVVTGLCPVFTALGVVAALGVAVCFRPSRAVVKIAISPFYALPIVLSFILGLWAGIGLTTFVVVFFVVRWDRILEETRETLQSATRRVET